MTHLTMRRLALCLAVLSVLAGSFVLSERASAQAFSSNAQVVVNGTKLKNNTNVYINAAQCSKESTWVFELQGYAQRTAYLEMWVTNNSSTNCADAANRTSATQSFCTDS